MNEKYIVVLEVNINDKRAKARLGTIKDWDGVSPLYYNGRYSGSYSGDITKAKVYSKLQDAKDRISRIGFWDSSKFNKAYVCKIKYEPIVEGTVFELGLDNLQ